MCFTRSYGTSDVSISGVATMHSSRTHVPVTDPRSIRVLSSFDVAGRVSDSRIVGDVLYVVSSQDGLCWGCSSDGPRSPIVALGIADPRQA